MSIKMDGICCVVVACVPQFLASPFARSFEYHCRGAGGWGGWGIGGHVLPQADGPSVPPTRPHQLASDWLGGRL